MLKEEVGEVMEMGEVGGGGGGGCSSQPTTAHCCCKYLQKIGSCLMDLISERRFGGRRTEGSCE